MLKKTIKKYTIKNTLKKSVKKHINKKIQKGKGKTYKDILKSNKSIPKINFEYKTSDYNIYNIPIFWLQLFDDEKLYNLKQTINDMMLYDIYHNVYHNEFTENWYRDRRIEICEINKQFYPNYYIPNKNKPYQKFNTLRMDINTDFINYNTILCACFILFGIINYKLKEYEIHLILKGGKAIQLASSHIKPIQYITEDIDILILDKNELYSKKEIQLIAFHIGEFIKWILNNKNNDLNISLKNPDESNPHIYKLSYIKTQQIEDYKTKQLKNEYKALCDIDFKEIPIDVIHYFENNHIDEFYIKDLDINVLYEYPNINNLLKERLYYVYYYISLLTTTKDYRLIDEYNRYINKFKIQIKYIINILNINKHKLNNILNSIIVDKKYNKNIINLIYNS